MHCSTRRLVGARLHWPRMQRCPHCTEFSLSRKTSTLSLYAAIINQRLVVNPSALTVLLVGFTFSDTSELRNRGGELQNAHKFCGLKVKTYRAVYGFTSNSFMIH